MMVEIGTGVWLRVGDITSIEQISTAVAVKTALISVRVPLQYEGQTTEQLATQLAALVNNALEKK